MSQKRRGRRRAASLLVLPKPTVKWEIELAEYRRLLAEQITIGSRDTAGEWQDYYRRHARINFLYGRLY